jgi:hypothetical protein
MATDFDIGFLLDSEGWVSVVDHYHFPFGLVGLHDAVRLPNVLEAEHAAKGHGFFAAAKSSSI